MNITDTCRAHGRAAWVYYGGCWPTHHQELLLQAALLQGKRSFESWAEWESSAGVDHLDEGSYRMLPLLYWNLHAQGIDHPLMNRLKGVHRRAWYENQILFHEMAPILEGFHKAGIRTMLLKGAALALRHYENQGLRPMRDIDILVPEEQAAPAIQLLKESKWVPITPVPAAFSESFQCYRHSIAFENASGRQMDLHWHVLYWCRRRGADREFWEDSVPMKFQDLPVRSLNPTDQFLHVCVHGIEWNDIPPMRWVADAMTILRTSRDIDWDRFVQQTRKRRLALPLKDALNYLHAVFDAPIPQAVLTALREMRISRDDFLDYERIINPLKLQGPIETFRAIYARYRRSAPKRRPHRHVVEFARFLQYYWDLEHPWQLLPVAGLWGVKRVGHTVRRSGGWITP
jgi:hypothetical protein